ncbi:MAG: sugar isomerase, partial [Lachnospiraceae bacterium]|nr:sugar isomerase [Lachnospiraceae bacterium]
MFAMIIVNGIPGVINFYFQRKYRTFLETIGDNYILINLGTITSVATSILKIVMLQMGVSILVVQTIYCCSSLVQMIYVYYYTKKKYPWIDFSVKPDHAALKQKNAALIHQICG